MQDACNVDILPFVQSKASYSFPPYQDSLRNNTMRAYYQAAIWHHALDANPEILSPSATNGLLDMVMWISTGRRYRLRLRHYWTLYYVDGLQTAQLVTVDAKEIAYLCLRLSQCSETCDNPHNYVLVL